MGWQRDMTQAPPAQYRGISMRSALEVAVAQELDALNATWAYEEPTGVPGYRPDFTIHGAPAELALPQWVEVKPAQLLYDARDAFGLPEDLHGTEQTVMAGPGDLERRHLTELPKPQRLAAAACRAVLVVSALNRFRTLSILCLGDRLEFSKWHPAVNWKGVLRERQHEEQRRQWASQAVDRKAEYDRRVAAHWQQVRRLVLEHEPVLHPARYDSPCRGCGAQRERHLLFIYKPNGEWLPICHTCRQAATGAVEASA